MKIALYVIVAFEALGALLAIGQIGKPRKPVTPANAVAGVIIAAAIIFVLVRAARGLG